MHKHSILLSHAEAMFKVITIHISTYYQVMLLLVSHIFDKRLLWIMPSDAVGS